MAWKGLINSASAMQQACAKAESGSCLCRLLTHLSYLNLCGGPSQNLNFENVLYKNHVVYQYTKARNSRKENVEEEKKETKRWISGIRTYRTVGGGAAVPAGVDVVMITTQKGRKLS